MITGSYHLIIRCDHPGHHRDKVYLDHSGVNSEGWLGYAGETREKCVSQALKDGWFIGADQKCLCPVHYVGSQK